MRTPCTLEEWRKNKSQKIETRNGLVPQNLREMDYHGIAVLVYEIGQESYICGPNGKINQDNTTDAFDLFIVKEK